MCWREDGTRRLSATVWGLTSTVRIHVESGTVQHADSGPTLEEDGRPDGMSGVSDRTALRVDGRGFQFDKVAKRVLEVYRRERSRRAQPFIDDIDDLRLARR